MGKMIIAYFFSRFVSCPIFVTKIIRLYPLGVDLNFADDSFVNLRFMSDSILRTKDVREQDDSAQ